MQVPRGSQTADATVADRPMSTGRLVVLLWGIVLVVVTGLPVAVALVRGFDPYDMDDTAAPAAYLTIGLLAVGALIVVGSVTRWRAMAWTVLASVPLIVALAGWVNQHAGTTWLNPLWRPVLFGACALLPALVLLSRGRR